jgi:NAD(P)H-nitrite reductase large subunit
MIGMVLEGVAGPEKLPIRKSDFYDRLNIEPLLGSRVSTLDAGKKIVITERGDTCRYHRLLIASGADPRPIKAEGLSLGNIFYMRTREHVAGILAALPRTKRALVLGGGLVGFKAAYGLLRRGVDVTMLIRSGHPLTMQVDETAGRMIEEALVKHGLRVHLAAEVAAFEGRKVVEAARLTDGTRLACDMVIIGKGVLPAVSFIPRGDIPVDLGVVVNGRLETGAPGVFAAGDAAEWIDIARKTRWVNAIWPEAAEQGHVAGANMAGRNVFYPGTLGRNVIRIFDTDVMTAGVVNPPADDPAYEVLTRFDPRQKRYRKLVFRNDRLVGMVLINAVETGGVLLSLIRGDRSIEVPKETLLDDRLTPGRITQFTPVP